MNRLNRCTGAESQLTSIEAQLKLSWVMLAPNHCLLWRVLTYSDVLSPGEVDAILEAAENGRAVPVFTQTPKVASAVSAPTFLKMKEGGSDVAVTQRPWLNTCQSDWSPWPYVGVGPLMPHDAPF